MLQEGPCNASLLELPRAQRRLWGQGRGKTESGPVHGALTAEAWPVHSDGTLRPPGPLRRLLLLLPLQPGRLGQGGASRQSGHLASSEALSAHVWHRSFRPDPFNRETGERLHSSCTPHDGSAERARERERCAFVIQGLLRRPGRGVSKAYAGLDLQSYAWNSKHPELVSALSFRKVVAPMCITG